MNPLLNIIEETQKEFDEKFPREMREVYKQGDGSYSSGIVIMNGILKSFIKYRELTLLEGVKEMVEKYCTDYYRNFGYLPIGKDLKNFILADITKVIEKGVEIPEIKQVAHSIDVNGSCNKGCC